MEATIIVLTIFLGTVILMIWRPMGINEATPAAIGALLISLIGIINLDDVISIFSIVSNASFTIISTLLMASLLESIGFFRHSALLLVEHCNGSGKKLFFFTLAFSFLMTLLFNNDGSILICTPIIIQITRMLNFKFDEAFPFLIGSALIATASSAPIGASNIANLVAMKIVGLDLNSQAKAIFIPAMIGILTLGVMLFRIFKKDLPLNYNVAPTNKGTSSDNLIEAQATVDTDETVEPAQHSLKHHPPQHPHLHKHLQKPLHKGPHIPHKNIKTDLASAKIQEEHNEVIAPFIFKLGLAIVVLIRISMFVAAYFNIPIALVSAVGTILIALVVARKQKSTIIKSLMNAPWRIFLFAFGMYVIIHALKKVGVFDIIAAYMQMVVGDDLFAAVFVNGFFSTILSALLNNHPTVMLNTSIIVQMGLPSMLTKAAYNATILGSDIGSLLTPIGTLASLIWFHIVNKDSEEKIKWSHYMKVSLKVIPLSLITSLTALYLWTMILY